MASERVTKSVNKETTRAKRFMRKQNATETAKSKAVSALKKGGMDIERNADGRVTTPKKTNNYSYEAPQRISRGNSTKSRDTVAAELNTASTKKEVKNAVNPRKRKVAVSGTGREMRMGREKRRVAYDDMSSKPKEKPDEWGFGDTGATRETVYKKGNSASGLFATGAVKKKTISDRKFKSNEKKVAKSTKKFVATMKKRAAAGKEPVSDRMRNRAAKVSTGARTAAQQKAYKAANQAAAAKMKKN
jgi:hypothetical protein